MSERSVSASSRSGSWTVPRRQHERDAAITRRGGEEDALRAVMHRVFAPALDPDTPGATTAGVGEPLLELVGQVRDRVDDPRRAVRVALGRLARGDAR